MSCKTGSVSTRLHSMRSSSASKCLSSFWRWMINPPRLHIIMWSTLKMSPQTQTEGVSRTSHSYACFTASRNLFLFKSKFVALIGKKLSQLEARFWVARSTALKIFQKSSLSPHQAFPSDTDSSLVASPVARRVLHFRLVAHALVILFVGLVDQKYWLMPHPLYASHSH